MSSFFGKIKDFIGSSLGHIKSGLHGIKHFGAKSLNVMRSPEFGSLVHSLSTFSPAFAGVTGFSKAAHNKLTGAYGKINHLSNIVNHATNVGKKFEHDKLDPYSHAVKPHTGKLKAQHTIEKIPKRLTTAHYQDSLLGNIFEDSGHVPTNRN